MHLAAELRHAFAIDLYHDTNYVPHAHFANLGYGCFDHRLFDRRWPAAGYRGILYQVDDSPFHQFIYQALQHRAGVVMLQEVSLTNFDVGTILNHAEWVVVPSARHLALLEAHHPQHVSRLVVRPPGTVGRWLLDLVDRCANFARPA
jgi:hypothetical protein